MCKKIMMIKKKMGLFAKKESGTMYSVMHDLHFTI